MQRSACFTGHRSISGNMTDVYKRLYQSIENDIKNHNVTDFYAGGAIGWDTLASQIVLKLRQTYPQIRLHLILPCSNEEQTANWTAEQKALFYSILPLADDVDTYRKNIIMAV